MRGWLASWSLGARMVAMFSVLLAAIAIFMVAYFPARMADQAQADAEERAASIAQVMSTALGPALEFDDPDNAQAILRWLATTRDARFGMVMNAEGRLFAAWRPAVDSPDDDILVITKRIPMLAGPGGVLHLGFSLEELAVERSATRTTVITTTLVVFVIGVLATMVLATFVVRPIRRLTRTALQISRGELPPELPAVTGGPEVARLAAALRSMLERINEVSQQELLDASRRAGMAEVATGVLHNVGNVLTSVNVSVELLRERTAALPTERLRRLGGLLAQGTPLDADRVAMLQRYVTVCTEALESQRELALKDLASLGGHVDHMKRVVAMQNAYARMRSVAEPTRVHALLQEAVELGCPPTRRGTIAIAIADGDWEEPVMIDRHRVLQIVVNLISNARDAVMASSGERRITIRATATPGELQIQVIDTGVGISAELLGRIFAAGFTSKPHGHGYGLHSSALAARQLGGRLEVASEGESRGATFTLVVPIEEAA